LKIPIVLILLLSSAYSGSGRAGSTLTVQYTSISDVYRVKYIFYRDCFGITALPSYYACYELNGVLIDSVKLDSVSSAPWQSSICTIPAPLPCSGGFGYEIYAYEGTVQITPGSYKFYVKNLISPITTISPPIDYGYSEAFIEVDTLLQNSLPEFNTNPEFRFCIFSAANYNSQAYDSNGDSIVYSIAPFMYFDTVLNTGVNYIYPPPHSPYNFMLFISPVLDMSTGMLSFTPQLIGNGIISIKADEYRNGQLIGSIRRQTTASVHTNGIASVEITNRTENHSLFPNPAKERIYIGNRQEFNYIIFDSFGRIISRGIASRHIDIDHLPDGIYILKSVEDPESFRFVKSSD
jgi:hypothetical protein